MPKIRFPLHTATAVPGPADPRQAASDREQVRALALGLEPTDVRARAIIAVAESDPSGCVPVLGTILHDKGTPARFRHLSATLLGRIESDAARDALLEALDDTDPGVVGQVAQSLGRIGDRSVVAPLTKATAALDGPPRAQARFALHLLAYRFDLDLPDKSRDDVPLLPKPGDEAPRIHAMRADPVEAQLAARDLAREPCGIALNEQSAQQFICDEAWSVMLFDRALGAPPLDAQLLARKRLAAVIGRKSGDEGLYSPSLLLLTAPERGGRRIRLALHQPRGTLTMIGSAAARKDGLTFELRSVVRPGGAAAWIEGVLAGEAIVLETGRVACSRGNVGRPSLLRRTP